uniref:NADH dehydrogenase subunit 6 n=1 Tax=Eisenia nordenskioldi nordenskioldi TaxID=1269247 RepID=A0A6B9ISA2_9ANNE|nr:NADH dehydrogenase subunit 6 [Eisenia nordenskioldi nordenskioldi]
MILSIFMLMMITSTLALYLAATPIILGVNILAMALLLSLVFASFMSSWFAFLIFLIYVGGMLVMFAYFLALTPNQQMNSNNLLYILIFMVILSLLTYSSHIKPPMLSTFNQGNSLLYFKYTAPMLIILALILLFTMVVVVKLSALSKGPLRPFIY